MRQNKILDFAANIVLCTLLLIAGCTKIAEKPAQTKIKSEDHETTVKLALKFTPADSTTYKVTTEADNSLIWEGADPNKPKGFTHCHSKDYN
jgi:hypothetical protein